MNFVDVILVVVCIVLTTLVAVQSAKGDLGEAITGANSELFKNQKERGAELFLSRATLISVVLLIVLAVVRNLF
jgi:preprotein translocase subunit SecG